MSHDLSMATELYQFWLEKCRLHPDDEDAQEMKSRAWKVLDHLWKAEREI